MVPYAKAYAFWGELKSERNDTMKEKELDIRRGDVDDMIFGNDAHISER